MYHYFILLLLLGAPACRAEDAASFAAPQSTDGVSKAPAKSGGTLVTFAQVLASSPKFRVPLNIARASRTAAATTANTTEGGSPPPPPPEAHPHVVGRRLARASGGWPLACVLQASLAALPRPLEKGAVLRFEPGSEAPHPVTACPHLVDGGGGGGPAARSARTGTRRSFLRAPAHAVDDGRLRWGASLRAAYSAINVTNFDSQQGTGHKTVFYDARVKTLMDGPGVVNATVYAAFLQLNNNLITQSRMKATADNGTDGGAPPPLNDPALASTVQTLTGATADMSQNVLMLQLAHYDAGTAAVEAQFNAHRDEKCHELWTAWERLGRKVDSYEYGCWCAPRSWFSATHCQAYSDMHGNATLNAMDAENAKRPEYPRPGDEGAAVPAWSGGRFGGGGGVGSGPAAGRRLAESDMLAAIAARALSPESRRALRRHLLAASAGASAGAGALKVNDDGRTVPSDALAPYGAPFTSPLTAVYGSHGRGLKKFCGFEKGGILLGLFTKWLIDSFAVSVQWGPSINVECCIPLAETPWVFCFGYYVGAFNFYQIDGTTVDSPDGSRDAVWAWDKVKALTTVACRGEHAYEDCAGQCMTRPEPFTDPKTGIHGIKCQLADDSTLKRMEMEFNFMHMFYVATCWNFLPKEATYTSFILNVMGLSICPMFMTFRFFPMRGWNWQWMYRFWVMMLRIQAQAEWGPRQGSDRPWDAETCAYYCACPPQSLLFGSSLYCKMCSHQQASSGSVAISLHVLFFDVTLKSWDINSPGNNIAVCPPRVLAKMAAASRSQARRKEFEGLLKRVDAGAPCGGARGACAAPGQSCLMSAKTNQSTCIELSAFDVHNWHAHGPDVLACANGTLPHGAGSFCGSQAVSDAAMRWSSMQDWVDAVANTTNLQKCPCSGTQSCLTVTPSDERYKLSDENGDDVTALCYTVTPAMSAYLEAHGALLDPNATREAHTHAVRCTSGEETWQRHGARSFCGWITGGYLAATSQYAATAADQHAPAALAALARADGAGGDGGIAAAEAASANGAVTWVRSTPPATGMPCGKLDGEKGPVTLCPPIDGMVCNGNPTSGIGRCVISERDNWLQHGCLADFTSSAGACKAVKLQVAADGQADVQKATDCSLRHAAEDAPAPAWYAGDDDGGGGGGGGGAERSGCEVLRADEFLEFKYGYVSPSGSRPSPTHLRLVVGGDGNLAVHRRDFSSDEVLIAPFEAVAHVGYALSRSGFARGTWVNGYSKYSVGRPPYHARLTRRALKMVNGAGQVYYEIPLPERFDPARPVFLRFATESPYPPQVIASLQACGVPAGAACADGDPGCGAAVECDLVQRNVW